MIKFKKYVYKSFTILREDKVSKLTILEQQNLNKLLTISAQVFHQFLKTEFKIQSTAITIAIISDQAMRKINFKFRNINKSTDVLSFPYQTTLRRGKIPPKIELLGDILISGPMAYKQAKTFKISNTDEIIHLVVHGFLHLCGFDHEISIKEEKTMEKFESKLLSKIQTNLKKM